MRDEVWKDIPGYEGYYQASNFGRIRSVNRYVRHYSGQKQIVFSRIIKSNSNGTGYLKVCVCKYNIIRTVYVHRLIASAFLGESTLHVNHINHNRSDNRLTNLEYVTIRQNQSKRKRVRDLPVGVTLKIGNRGHVQYRSIIHKDGKSIHLGYFKTPNDARLAYLKAL